MNIFLFHFSLDNNLALRKDKKQFDFCLEQLNKMNIMYTVFV